MWLKNLSLIKVGFLFKRLVNDHILESKFNQAFIDTNQKAAGPHKILKNVT